MAIKKTHEEYIEQVKKINPNIEVVGIYKNNRTKILHRCKIDGNEWEVIPNNILSGKGCPICKNKKLHDDRTKGHEQYIQELKNINPYAVVIGKYINATTKIMHKCLIDGYEWETTPNKMLDGHGCPMCSKNKKKTQQEYIGAVFDVNSDIEVLGEYINSQTCILHKCKKCNTIWNAIPNNILRGHGCPVCSGSKGEQQIKEYLNTHNVDFEPQHTFKDCKDIQVLQFDFYLSNYNACIEYDGRQHFMPIDYFGGQQGFESTQRRDAIKTNYCTTNNIPLLRIRYDEDISSALDNFLDSLTV